MFDFETKVYNFIKKERLFVAGEKVLLGVSGGADSVCLLRVLHKLSGKLGISGGLAVAHINHMIRGKEADEDEIFTKELCDELKVPFFSFHKDIPAMAKELGISTEEAGRNYRYEVFGQLANKMNYTKIAVAHHENDLAETVIFNMIRGSGLSGMVGIEAKRDNIVRPLLCVGRDEIEEYLSELNQSYRTDSTNDTLDYTRNKIRHIILPAMEEINSGVYEHIASLASDAGKTQRFIDNATKNLRKECIFEEEGRNSEQIIIDISGLKDKEYILANNIIHDAISKAAGRRKDITRRHIEAVRELMELPTGRMCELPYMLIARRSYDRIIIEKKCEASNDVKPLHILPDLEFGKIGQYELPNGSLSIELKEGNTEPVDVKNRYTKFFDYDKIQGGICIRFPEDGDYIVIDTDGKTKKLNRIFIDNKIDRQDRTTWPVIALGKEILWAVGIRYNERFRISENTKRVMLVTYTSDNK